MDPADTTFWGLIAFKREDKPFGGSLTQSKLHGRRDCSHNTSSQAASDKVRTYRLGAIRYVQKPSQLEEFFAKVGQAVKELLAVKEMPKAKPASSARSVVNRQRREPEPKNRVR